MPGMSPERSSQNAGKSADTVELTVRFLGPASDWAGRDEQSVSLPASATLGALIERLRREYPALARAGDSLQWAVNAEYATPTTELRAGDEVAAIPPVSGGQAEKRARLTGEPIDVAAVAASVQDDRCGAVVTFVGTARAAGDDEPLEALEYAAYDDMAAAKLNDVCDEAASRFCVHRVACVHRLGRLKIGEASIAIAVSAAHRADAFAAARFVIDAVKKVVPIWKKELYRSGRTCWVDPTK